MFWDEDDRLHGGVKYILPTTSKLGNYYYILWNVLIAPSTTARGDETYLS
jgi:hypothetical protein